LNVFLAYLRGIETLEWFTKDLGHMHVFSLPKRDWNM